jgi:bacillithiol biosynthesis deacetylase BshB1
MDLDALAFGAHADDVEIICGGTIIKLAALGYKTGVIALTRGEMATRGTPEIRAEEFKKSAEIMGLAVHKMLDIPDGRVEVTWENKLKVIAEIRAYKPKVVFAPYWVERHPDHEHGSHLVRESAYLSGLKKIDTGQDAYRPRRVIFYQGRFEFAPSFVVDTSDVHDRKISAIMAYASQFRRPDRAGAGPGFEQTSLNRPEFLDNIEVRDRRYGLQIGAKYGEPFLICESLKVDDPVALFGPESSWTIP